MKNIPKLVKTVISGKPDAHGAYGEIYKIVIDGQKKVLKIVRADEEIGVSNLIELDIMKRFDHPNIMQADHISSIKINSEYRTVIIMDEADCDLWSHLDNVLSLDEKLKIITDVCLGLAFLHKNNILHLDLNPSNILLFKSQNNITAKITDFGLSLYLSSTDTERTFDQLLVTITHRPPEVGNKSPFTYSKATDMWSLGLIIYQILADGDIPYPKLDTQSINHVLSSQFHTREAVDAFLKENLKEDVPADLVLLCGDLLDPVPSKRPSIGLVLERLKVNVVEGKVKKAKIKGVKEYAVDNYYAFNALYIMGMEFKVYLKTVFLAIDLYHRTLKVVTSKKGWHNCLARMTTCFFMAAKLCEDEPILPEDLCDFVQRDLVAKDLFQIESLIVNHVESHIYRSVVDKGILYKQQLLERFETGMHPILYEKFKIVKGEKNKYKKFAEFFKTTEFYKNLSEDTFICQCMEKDCNKLT